MSVFKFVSRVFTQSRNVRLIQTSFIRNERKIGKGVMITHTRDKLHRQKGIKDKKPDVADETAALIPYSPVSDPAVDELIDRAFRIKGTAHQVLVIQPFIRKDRYTEKRTPDDKLAEAVHLVESITDWKVVRTAKVGLTSIRRKYFFGPGQLERIANEIKGNSKITAVFLSHPMLFGYQQYHLEQELGVPVYDRYTIIIQIFKDRAKSKETLLQIQLAQLPYLWTRIQRADEGIVDTLGEGSSNIIGNIAYPNVRKDVLRKRESKLKIELEKLKEHRQFLREKRKESEVPTIAVVGYTNAGKTSLIKALTESKRLKPQNSLFATIDVTVHQGYLPSGLDVVYIDTIGFISDVPDCLMQSFQATLEDAALADIILHVRDISHPNMDLQCTDVIETLNNLNLPFSNMSNVITVFNKIDLLKQDELKNYQDPENEIIFVSADKTYGIDYLRFKIEAMILHMTNRSVVVMKVKSGSDEYFWLHDEASVVEEQLLSPDSEYVNVKVIITESAMSRFKYHFISNYREKW